MNSFLVAHAEITGGSEVHVEQGSTLNLTCVVKNSKEKPHYLLWYHKNEVGMQEYSSENSKLILISDYRLHFSQRGHFCGQF